MNVKRWFEEKKLEVTFVITVMGVVITVFNYVIAYKLLPFATRQDLFDSRIQAIEGQVSKNTDGVAKIGVIDEKIDSDTKRLDRIESKIDLLIDRLNK